MNKDKLKARFEANMLDGDDLKDCGGSMLSAECVYEYLDEELDIQIDEIIKLIEDTPCPPNIHAMAFKQKIINVIQDNE